MVITKQVLYTCEIKINNAIKTVKGRNHSPAHFRDHRIVDTDLEKNIVKEQSDINMRFCLQLITVTIVLLSSKGK